MENGKIEEKKVFFLYNLISRHKMKSWIFVERWEWMFDKKENTHLTSFQNYQTKMHLSDTQDLMDILTPNYIIPSLRVITWDGTHGLLYGDNLPVVVSVSLC